MSVVIRWRCAYNLPYRRLAVGETSAQSSALELAGALQDAILRNGRLQICATAA